MSEKKNLLILTVLFLRTGKSQKVKIWYMYRFSFQGARHTVSNTKFKIIVTHLLKSPRNYLLRSHSEAYFKSFPYNDFYIPQTIGKYKNLISKLGARYAGRQVVVHMECCYMNIECVYKIRGLVH